VAKKYGKAEKVLLQAITKAPKDAQIRFNLGVVYRRQEKIDKAIVQYSKAVELKPTYAKAWYDLGHMHRLNHDNEKAVNAFSHYLELTKGKDPKSDAAVKKQIDALK
jgi:Flp pilus assembly protein TadD